MRTRTRDNTIPFVSPSDNKEVTDWDCDQQTLSEGLPYSQWTGSRETMTDRVSRNYAERSGKGEIINNPMTSIYEERQLQLGYRSYYVQWDEDSDHPDCTYSQSISESSRALRLYSEMVDHIGVDFADGLVTEASTAAWANVDDPIFEGAVFLAELRETISFLEDPLKNWNKFLKNARKRKNRKRNRRAITTARFIADNWLAYRYAIRPIVNDIQNAIDAIMATVETPVRATARGSASSTGSGFATYSGSGGTSGGSEYLGHALTTGSKTVRAGVLYEHYREMNTFGVTVLDIPGAAWEAIRFSFIIDWFVNIGPWISSLSPRHGVKPLASWTTTHTILDTTRKSFWNVGGTTSVGPRIITSPGACEESYTTITKGRSPGAVAGITFRSHPLRGSLGVGRVLDLLAIGDGLLSKR